MCVYIFVHVCVCVCVCVCARGLDVDECTFANHCLPLLCPVALQCSRCQDKRLRQGKQRHAHVVSTPVRKEVEGAQQVIVHTHIFQFRMDQPRICTPHTSHSYVVCWLVQQGNLLAVVGLVGEVAC